MTPEGKAHSIHDRLLAMARSSGTDFNLMLIRYSLERYLYRISVSPHKENFLLKGALLFSLWYDSPRRPTRDADLLGLENLDMDAASRMFRDICAIDCDDGMIFIGESVRAIEIREDLRYGGIRVTLIGRLGNARCKVQIDIGYGDAVTPEPNVVRFPTLLQDGLSPELKAYPKETVIAEKLEAIVNLGMANSRMKDYFDLYLLLGEAELDQYQVALAIRRTFERRKTPLPRGVPVGLSDDFIQSQTKILQWKAFLSKNGLEAHTLAEVVRSIQSKAGEIMSRIEESPQAALAR